MNDYYKNLADINFFSGDSYINSVDTIKVVTKSPGLVLWETWNSQKLSANIAEKIFNEIIRLKMELHFIEEGLKKFPQEYALLTLSVCEHAYRNDNESLFNLCINFLRGSDFDRVRLKAEKLFRAYYALKLLSDHLDYQNKGSISRLEKIQLHALDFLKGRFHNNFSYADFQVEIPVRKDWESQKMCFTDPRRVETFYKTTYSYILELIAANHQVETLFNYVLVIEKLKELGVKTIYDYAGGVGTFVLLAKFKGLDITFSELDSITRDYAIKRIDDSGDDIDFEVLDYDSPDLDNEMECIVCTEVLEHIFKPDELIHHFYSRLKKGGVLVVSESFDYVENFCTHLPLHKGKGGVNFINSMKEIGFIQVDLKYETHPLIFQKP